MVMSILLGSSPYFGLLNIVVFNFSYLPFDFLSFYVDVDNLMLIGRAGRPRPRSAFESLMPKPKPIKDEELSEDLIKASKFPAAKQPPPNEVPKVERDDWPGPPFPPIIKRWWSKSLGRYANAYQCGDVSHHHVK